MIRRNLKLITLMVLAIVIVTLPAIFFLKYEYIDSLGSYGGFVGGIAGSIISLITVVLVYKTFRLQEHELKQMRDQIQKQQFESNFFSIMNMLRSVTSELTLKKIHLERETRDHEVFKSFDVFIHVYESVKYYDNHEASMIQAYIADCINIQYGTNIPTEEKNYGERFAQIFDWRKNSDENALFYSKCLYKAIDRSIGGAIDPFFNTVKFLLEEINRLANPEFYVRLIQSQLNNYQFFVLFYRGMEDKRLGALMDKLS